MLGIIDRCSRGDLLVALGNGTSAELNEQISSSDELIGVLQSRVASRRAERTSR